MVLGVFNNGKSLRPPIKKEKEFIVWILKNYDAPDIENIRGFLSQTGKVDYYIDLLDDGLIRNLNEHPNGESLLDFLSEAHEHYVNLVSLINKRGGFHNSPIELQDGYIQLTAKMITLPYFIIHKYGLDISWLLKELKLKDLNDLS